MTVKARTFSNLSKECFDIGAHISRLRKDKNKHRKKIRDCQRDIQDGERRVRELTNEIHVTQATKTVLENTPKVLGPVGATAGIGLSKIIKLARKIDELKTERDRLSNAISICKRALNDGIRALTGVEFDLNRMNDKFARLDCGASTIPF